MKIFERRRKMRKIFDELKTFLLRGNAMDLAVGVIIGAAFSAVVNSLVKDLLMPILSLITGRHDFSNLFVALNGKHYDTLAQAQAAGVSTFNYGSFITAVINFILIGIGVFIIIKSINKVSSFHKKEETKKEMYHCAFCRSEINKDATRCPHCTSPLSEDDRLLQ